MKTHFLSTCIWTAVNLNACLTHTPSSQPPTPHPTSWRWSGSYVTDQTTNSKWFCHTYCICLSLIFMRVGGCSLVLIPPKPGCHSLGHMQFNLHIMTRRTCTFTTLLKSSADFTHSWLGESEIWVAVTCNSFICMTHTYKTVYIKQYTYVLYTYKTVYSQTVYIKLCHKLYNI